MVLIQSEQQAHVKKCIKHAATLGEGVLDGLLELVFRYAEDDNKKVVIFKDGSFNAEYNLGFTIYTLGNEAEPNPQYEWQRWRSWYSGGIIFHGDKWMIHT